MKLYTQAEAAKKFGLSRRSLLRYEEAGLIEPVRTPGGQRRYPESELLRLYGLETKPKKVGDRAGLYSRVSTRKQAETGNLERQTRRLKEYAQAADYEIVEVYEEIASGLNENRRQLRKLLNAVIAGRINVVVVEYKDRLGRFGYAYLKLLCESHGARIEAIEEKASEDENEELVKDLISVVASFSARLYGRRGGRKAKRELERRLRDEDNDTRRSD
jgi:predicted site-specific integrase-resolvase